MDFKFEVVVRHADGPASLRLRLGGGRTRLLDRAIALAGGARVLVAAGCGTHPSRGGLCQCRRLYGRSPNWLPDVQGSTRAPTVGQESEALRSAKGVAGRPRPPRTGILKRQRLREPLSWCPPLGCKADDIVEIPLAFERQGYSEVPGPHRSNEQVQARPVAGATTPDPNSAGNQPPRPRQQAMHPAHPPAGQQTHRSPAGIPLARSPHAYPQYVSARPALT